MPRRVNCFKPLEYGQTGAQSVNTPPEGRSPRSGAENSAHSSSSSNDSFHKPQRSALTEALQKAGLVKCPPPPPKRSALTEALQKAGLKRSDIDAARK